ncbi:helicase associated domain-containing protein [Streptomyces sp. NPDC058623]|uniref:helicase associated domain-containing protein n=1 Tax=Streptomyces sp. NPDC058623 TaxID=3346563 RepID=UPI0036632AA4
MATGYLEVPYNHVEGAFPLGRWLSDQQRAFRARGMSGGRAAELEALGIGWDVADQGFAENLAAARAYYLVDGNRSVSPTTWWRCRPRGSAPMTRSPAPTAGRAPRCSGGA